MFKSLRAPGFYSSMLRLAIPVATQNLLMAAFQLIDSAMVSKLGNAAMAGVGMAGRWNFIMMITLFGINSGAAILYSQYKGVDDQEGIRRVYGFALGNTMVVVLLFGLMMALFPVQMITVFAGAENPEAVRLGAEFMQIIAFNCIVMGFNFATTIMLRSTEEVRVPLFTSLLAVSINTGLNYLLIYGNLGFPRLGVRGAAVSTLISSFAQMCVLVAVLRARKHPVFARLRGMFAFTGALAGKFYRTAMPVMINEVLWVMGSSVYLFVFGRVGGENGVPAYVLYTNIDQLLFSFVVGLASACGVMVGKSVGAGDEAGAWSSAKRFLVFGMLFSVAMGVAEVLLRVPLINLIRPEDQATGDLAKQLILIGSAGLPLRMLSMLLIVAIFRAGGKPVMGAVIDVGCVLLVGAPVMLLAGFTLRLPFLWLFALMFAEEAVKAVVGVYYFFRRNWMRKLTDDPPALPAEEPGVLEPAMGKE